MYTKFGISEEVQKLGREAELSLSVRFPDIDRIAEYNQLKIIHAMQKNRVSEAYFAATTGYGHNDLGRDALERVYADVFHAEAALVRPQITCGTHALAVALFANLRPGDLLWSPVGRPYDTLEEVIGLRESRGSLREYGIGYRETPLLPDGTFDYEAIGEALKEPGIRLAEIQRSKGYMERRTFSVREIGELIRFIRERRPDIITMVDNCYGEFTETEEPTDAGADMAVGSLIKNPGGGLAPVGGYIVGKQECIEECANRLSAPGLGQEIGANLGLLPSFYQGLFLAPAVVASAVKSAVFAASMYEKLGFYTLPGSGEERHDIIQAIRMNTPEAMEAFARGVQEAAPVDSFVRPVASEMAGYGSKVIMAAGTFVSGSSIELSADGPMRPPYIIFFQGGLTYFHGKLGVLKSVQALLDAGIVKLPQLW